MTRRPLPRVLTRDSAQITGRRGTAWPAAGSARVLHPLITVMRGLRRLAGAGRRGWTATPKDRRGALLFLVASVILVVALVPYGPPLGLSTLVAVAAWKGRGGGAGARDEPDASRTERLRALYEALVPYFSVPEDPRPLYAHGGDWQSVFGAYEFGADGRLSRLELRYPAYFTDGEAEARTRIEHLLHAKSGRGREYHFEWHEEANELTVTVLPPLPARIVAQRFITAPGETVLGLTDATAVQRTLPVIDNDHPCDVPPVLWRTGSRSTEPHLLAVGQPGSGTTTLLRSVALQALRYGDVLIVDGSGTGEYACLTGRSGVLAVECGLTGALSSLEWAAHETERRLIAANRARQAGHAPPPDTRRPLWLLIDRPGVLGHLAVAGRRPHPQTLLDVPLRHGRTAQVTVVVAEQFDALDALSDAVRQHTRARVVLGTAPSGLIDQVLGTPPCSTPAARVPPGRGYARLGTGPVLRLQVPATPDPYDEATSEEHRQAVLGLLPEPVAGAGAAPAGTAPATMDMAVSRATAARTGPAGAEVVTEPVVPTVTAEN